MMRNNLKILFWLPMLALVVFGCRSCETIDSSKLDPSEIHQTYNVTSSPDGTSVDATFRVSGQRLSFYTTAGQAANHGSAGTCQ